MKREQVIFQRLKKNYPIDKTLFLNYSSHLELLFATILSAQCTDARVNIVTKTLFKKYGTVEEYAKAKQSELEKDIRSTGFYLNKAKNIIGAAKKIARDFGGKVPSTMEDLLTLPGVARKTANIVLWNGFGKADGIAIDTHAKRLAYRMGLSANTDPNKVEQDLMGVYPKKQWGFLNHLFVLHGRALCMARKPNCAGCFLKDLCPKKGV
ncbi:endonuclease III [Candidatus Woesearchaeota archaeon]|nr:endonuclease III [Candidatus Woesearchaeota archaeon]HIH38509.1 endonuclease III [Candidatus Woesearchaeota archaeon]HIJ04467.1 endonuclease III [Candidatus Woesearchaeota archaeon]